MSATLSTGTLPTDARVAARTTNAAPATPAAPFDASNRTSNNPICCSIASGVFVACARNTAAVARYKHVPSRLNEYPVGMTRPTGVFELCDHSRKYHFRRRCRQHDQQFFPYVSNELQQAKAAPMSNRPKDAKNENKAGDIKGDQ